MNAICISFSIVIVYRMYTILYTILYTEIVYGHSGKRYFGRLKLGLWMWRRILDRGLHAGRVVYTHIQDLHKNLSHLSPIEEVEM